MMTFSQIVHTAAAGLVAGLLLAAMPAAAQAPSGDGVEQGSRTPHQLVISRKTFDAFIGATVTLTRLREIWQPKIRAAKSDEDAQKLVDAAREEMKQAIENAPGISLEEYVAIAHAARQSKQLARAIEKQVREARRMGE